MQTASEVRREQKQAIRAFAAENLYAFYRLGFSSIAPEAEFSDSPHFRVLAHALQRVATGEVKRLLIAIPPRHGKSLLSSVVLPAWIHGRDPTRKIICASYGEPLSKDFAGRYRDFVGTDACRGVFPHLRIDAGGSALSEIRTTGKGYRMATTVGGAATGKGAHFIIVDDPFKAAEITSDVVRNGVYAWVKNTLMTRFDNPGEGAMVVVHQRLHLDDLIGRLKDEGGWEYLDMPGEAVERKTYDLGFGETWTLEPGDLLYEDRFDAAALERLQVDLGSQYPAQILQRPAPPGGTLFKLKYFPRYDVAPAYFEGIYQSWDPAVVDTETAAFTVCTTWGVIGQKLYLLHVLRKKMAFASIEPAILHMKEKYNAYCVVLETSGVGAAIGDAILKREGARRWFAWHEPKLGKVERAIAQLPKIERKRVYLPKSADWLETFEAEVAEFPQSKYADQVDSMVQFLFLMGMRTRWTSDLTAWRDHREQPF